MEFLVLMFVSLAIALCIVLRKQVPEWTYRVRAG